MTLSDGLRKEYQAVIDRYIAKHPREWEAWKMQQYQRRQQLFNKYGTMKVDEAQRWAGSVPQLLDTMLRKYSTEALDGKDYLSVEFLNAFPIFKVAEKL